MESIVEIRAMSRGDVDRGAGWLETGESKTSWIGHYRCGDSVHLGYDAQHMLETSDSEWDSVFSDDKCLISAIYTDGGVHLAECQVDFDSEGGADLSILSSSIDLWRDGFGTSVVAEMVKKAFRDFRVSHVRVNVHEQNGLGIRTLERLGFVRVVNESNCMPEREDDYTSSIVLSITADSYWASQSLLQVERNSGSTAILNVSGLLGSTSLAIAKRAAKELGYTFVDDGDIFESVRNELRCTKDELREFENSHTSLWGRLLNKFTLPTGIFTIADFDCPEVYVGSQNAWITDEALNRGNPNEISEQRYQSAMLRVVRQFAVQGNVVIHGHYGQMYMDANLDTMKIFISGSPVFRAENFAGLKGLAISNAVRRLKKIEVDEQKIFQHLHDWNPNDLDTYDLTLNVEHMSVDEAVAVVVSALERKLPTLDPSIDEQISSVLKDRTPA